jgi:hypothetical protein
MPPFLDDVVEELSKRASLSGAVIRLGRAAFYELVYYLAPSEPGADLVAIARDHGGRWVEMVDEQWRERCEAIGRRLESWGKPGMTLYGVPLECSEDLEGWELV